MGSLRGPRTDGEMTPEISLDRQRPAEYVFSKHVERKMEEIREAKSRPELVPDRERVVDPLRMQMVEVGGPVLDRRTLAHGSPRYVSMTSTANSGQFDLAR